MLGLATRLGLQDLALYGRRARCPRDHRTGYSEMTIQSDTERILIFDFGSQYAQLIARRVREQNVFCQLVRANVTAERVRELKPSGIILSGGPASVYEK